MGLKRFKEDVKQAQHLMDVANNQLDKAVHKARTKGLTWDEIAQEVGITKQGAWARWSKENRKNA